MGLTTKASVLGEDKREKSTPSSLFSLKLFIKIDINKSAQIINIEFLNDHKMNIPT